MRTANGDGAFLAQRINRDFGWGKLVTVYTPSEVASAWRELEGKLAKMRNEVMSAPKSVEPIDWAAWSKQISTPGVVDELKAQYEKALSSTVESKPDFLPEVNKNLDELIARAESSAKYSKAEIDKARNQLKEALQNKAKIHNASLEYFYARFPGLEEQLRDEFMNGIYASSETEERLAAADVNEIKKSLKTGSSVDLGAMLENTGNYNLNEEFNKLEAAEKSLYPNQSNKSAIQRPTIDHEY